MSNCLRSCSCHRRQTEIKSIVYLRGLHNFCILCGQIIAATILISLTLWLLLRQTEPSAYVNNFVLGAFKDPNSTLIHYNITLHNPDIYKSVIYDILVLRIHYKDWRTKYGVTINLDGFDQGPGRSRVLSNHTASTGYEWTDYLKGIEDGDYPFELRFVMIVRFLFFGKVIANRQIMRVAEVYFDSHGDAFIDRRRGLRFE